MTLTFVIVALAALVVVAVPIFYFFLGYRSTDFLFFFILAFLAVWLNRLNSYTIQISDSPFFLLWAINLGIAFLLFWFPSRRTRQLLSPATKRTAIASLTLVAWLMLSNIAASETDLEVVRGIQATCYVVIPFLTAWAIVRACRVDENRSPRLILSLLLFGAVIGVVSIISGLMPGTFRSIVMSAKTEAESGRAFSPMGGPAATAMCILPIYCLAGGQLLSGRRRALSAGVMVICFLAILTTLARAAVLSFVIANIYLFAWQWRGLGKRLMVLTVIGVLMVGPLLVFFGRSYSLERLVRDLPGRQYGGSVQARIGSIGIAFRYGAKRPWVGGGWGLLYPFVRVERLRLTAPQYIYLDGQATVPMSECLYGLVFAEAGLVALLALLFLFWTFWRSSRPPDARLDASGHHLARGFRAGLLAFFLMCVFQDNLFNTTKLALFFYLYTFMGLAIIADIRQRTEVIPNPFEGPSKQGFVLGAERPKDRQRL